MKITTLPSGSIRVQVYTHSEWEVLPDGSKKEHKKFKSFTSKDSSAKGKKKLLAEAALYASQREEMPKVGISMNEGLKRYVQARENVLSASTLREFNRVIKNGLPYVGDKLIDSITVEDIQSAINQYSVNHAYKTVKNYRGYITSVLGVYRPNMVIRLKMPQKEKKEIYIPTDEEIKKILREVENTDMEIPVMLAAFGPLRRGEICGLRYENICGNSVHICENKVLGTDGYVIKNPKSFTSDRTIEFPDFVIKKFTGTKGPVTNLTPAAITCRFEHVLQHAGVKKFRFHDLRHWCISTLHDMGVPDADIILRSGHSSVAILEQVYLHAKSERIKEMNKKANAHFASMMDS